MRGQCDPPRRTTKSAATEGTGPARWSSPRARCASTSPPDWLPVVEGPPEPPAPTLVRFERKVVAVHGRIDRDPNQLDCDTLRLTLVPATRRRRERERTRPSPAESRCDERGAGPAGRAADLLPSRPPDGGPTDIAIGPASPLGRRPNGPATRPGRGGADGTSQAEASGGDAEARACFGNLTLQKAHATGHAVWLQLRAAGRQGALHRDDPRAEPALSARLDLFPRHTTRPVWLEKIDYEPEESSDRRGRPRRPVRFDAEAGTGRSTRSRT